MRVGDGDALAGLEVGAEVKADIFEAGEYVDVTGVTKGKGFAGTIKRHNFHRAAHEPRLHVPPGRGFLGRDGSGRGCFKGARCRAAWAANGGPFRD